MKFEALKLSRILNRFTGIILLCLAVGIYGGFRVGKHTGYDQGADRRRTRPNGSSLCKPGPWGELAYTPFTIAAPYDILPVRTLEAQGTHWFLKGYTVDSFVTLLQSTSLTLEQRQALLDPAVLHVRPTGIELTPPPDLVISLPDDVRGALYPIIAQFAENNSGIHFIHVNTIDERFSRGDVSPDTVALFKRLCYRRGNYLMFTGVPAVLSRLPTYEKKLAFVRALTRERTMLLQLHITPKVKVDALAQYWGKGDWDSDVRTVMDSLTVIPNGAWMDILLVLPPLPTAELYSYPTIADNPMDGPPVNRDCHWTSLNFFRDVPDPNFGKAEYAIKELKENYFPAPGDPIYGDVVLFAKPDGSIIHSAVYLADDICFTKNGGTIIHPWMLSTISDLLEQYSFQVAPDQKLTVTYFRNKRL